MTPHPASGHPQANTVFLHWDLGLGKLTKRYRDTEGQRERERERETEGLRDKERQRHREGERERETDHNHNHNHDHDTRLDPKKQHGSVNRTKHLGERGLQRRH